ncbi:fasciclin domain-containing protein, partial [Kribbella sp. NPDC051952]
MSRKIVRAGVAASALALVLATAACGSDDDTSSGSPSTSTSSSAPAETPSASASMDNASGLVGAGCADYAKANPSGAGSIDGMAAAPLATAASGNPLLKTLVA